MKKIGISKILTLCLVLGALSMAKVANAQCPKLDYFAMGWVYCDADGTNERAEMPVPPTSS